jgi:hypothetical protein
MAHLSRYRQDFHMYGSEMGESSDKITVKGVDIHLVDPPDLDVKWVGMEEPLGQLIAAWDEDGADPAMQPRILGKPGVGKTSLAITAAKLMKQDLYIFQCTVDTKPEDLIISPVIADNGKIRYVASPLVSAIARGGVCLLDEGNRMSEKSWASICAAVGYAPLGLFDYRRRRNQGQARVSHMRHHERRRVHVRGARIHSLTTPAGHLYGLPDEGRGIPHTQVQAGGPVR